MAIYNADVIFKTGGSVVPGQAKKCSIGSTECKRHIKTITAIVLNSAL